MVVIYVFNGQIDHYYHRRWPLQLDEKLKQWLSKYFPYYNNLSDNDKTKFEYRTGLYISGRAFKSIGSEQRDVPEDIKCMIAVHGVQMTLGLDDYLIGDMDRIFLYKHPFPSPKMPWLHHVETDIEDGVIILSLEQLTNAILNPSMFYNIAYHAYAEAIVGVHGHLPFPVCEGSWNKLEEVGGFSKDQIEKQTGHKSIDPLIVHIHYYFVFRNNYEKIFPEFANQFYDIFNQ